MISDKAVLLERIRIAIKKKWFQNGSECQELKEDPDVVDDTTPQHIGVRDSLNHSMASLNKLEHRMDSIELANEELLQFMDFLVEKLPDLIINILRGGTVGKSEVAEKSSSNNCGEPISEYSSYKKIIPHPTRRERDVLALLEKGFCAKEIAKKLFISETTVVTHKKNLKEKYNAKNTVELISKASVILTDPNTGYLNG